MKSEAHLVLDKNLAIVVFMNLEPVVPRAGMVTADSALLGATGQGVVAVRNRLLTVNNDNSLNSRRKALV